MIIKKIFRGIRINYMRNLFVFVLIALLFIVHEGVIETGQGNAKIDRTLFPCDEFKGAIACTQQYDPVCAKVLKGTHAPYQTEWKTFSNACMACISSARTEVVVGYRPGVCSQEECIGEGGSVPVVPNAPKCCEGLKPISCDRPNERGVCRYGCVGTVICANCGNGVCGLGENKCNCPEDCV
jgi:hypothetical protein